ncbi:armadillo repeat-containing protein 10 isoform X1 [Rana temporaria]|uniref:armadillo repeat-containing protein 10 isoform X1 n=1 Tax=Rana temporaria TaxID=8407 RepID=UPI001AACFE5B|nr:armadillo repeat-containing protein 10 isoform X1 [Rana temporaria]
MERRVLAAGSVTRGLLGLAVGAGLCYCAYRALASKEKKKNVTGGRLLEKVSNMTAVQRVQSGGTVQIKNIPTSASNLEPHHLKALLEMLDSNANDSSVQEQALVTLCNSAAFSANHDIIRNFNGIKIIGTFLLHPSLKIKTKALNALNNLSMNLQNQEQIKDFLYDVCNDIKSSSLNSEVQLAGLRLAINMSVTNNYHDYLADYIPCFFTLLVDGEEATKIHTLKVLVNLSANPSMTTVLLSSEAPSSLTNLFGSNTNREILIRALTFAANLSENLDRQQHSDGQRHYEDYSLYALLFRDQTVFQRNLVALLQHPDKDIKEHVARLLCPQKLNLAI